MENRTARPAILIDPNQLFEDFCGARELTPLQVGRQLIRRHIVDNAGGCGMPERLTANVLRPD